MFSLCDDSDNKDDDYNDNQVENNTKCKWVMGNKVWQKHQGLVGM